MTGPCRLQRAELSIKINAPSRTLEIGGFEQGKYQVLHRQVDPNGKLTFTIDNPAVLTVDKDNGIRLAITVSESQEQPEQADPDEHENEDEELATKANQFNPNRNM